MKQLWQWVVGMVFPEFCVGCGKGGVVLCEVCWQQIPWMLEQICPMCGDESEGGLTHKGCVVEEGMDGVWCVGYYAGPIKKIIRQMKYGRVTAFGEVIGQLFRYSFEQSDVGIEAGFVVGVPMTKAAIRKRGFNQAGLLGGWVAEVMGWGVVEGLVERSVQRLSQTKLGREERRLNVLDSFEVSFGLEEGKELIMGKTFIIVDDVFTSGATMRELARVLKEYGARRVYGVALAHER